MIRVFSREVGSESTCQNGLHRLVWYIIDTSRKVTRIKEERT